MSDSELRTMACHHCGHEWHPFVDNPKVCPACKHPTNGRQPIQPKTCEKCGYEWLPRVSRPVACPSCFHRFGREVREPTPPKQRVVKIRQPVAAPARVNLPHCRFCGAACDSVTTKEIHERFCAVETAKK